MGAFRLKPALRGGEFHPAVIERLAGVLFGMNGTNRVER
jgi:hypothetical protein